MEKGLLNLLESIGTLRSNLDQQRRRISSLPGLRPKDILNLLMDKEDDRVSADGVSKYLNKKGIFPSQHELEILFKILDVRKQGYLCESSISQFFQLKQTVIDTGKAFSDGAIDNIIESLLKMILAGCRQIRKARRLMLSYKDTKWGQWLANIRSKQKVRVTVQQLELFLDQSYTDKHIIEGLKKELKDQNIAELNEQTLRRLATAHCNSPTTTDVKTNADLKVCKFVKQISRKFQFKENTTTGKLEKLQNFKLCTERRFDDLQKQAEDLRSQRLQNVTRLKNKQQPLFYGKLRDLMGSGTQIEMRAKDRSGMHRTLRENQQSEL